MLVRREPSCFVAPPHGKSLPIQILVPFTLSSEALPKVNG
jgi:hypothetical protein